MSEYYNIVPWYDKKEWLEAYNYIYVTFNREAAHNLLLIWKARCPSLPSGIESTLTLLEVLLQDDRNVDNEANDQLLRLAYSSAIMRFVNHMLDTQTAKGASLYLAAKNLGVPDWIIDLRHDTAHSNKLPSIELLREASFIGLKWLEKNYWLDYKSCITDYVTGFKDFETDDNNRISALMHFCISLSFCAHSKCNIKNLSDIPDANMRKSILNDARDLFGDHHDFSKLKNVSIASLINILNAISKKILKCRDSTLYVNQALLGEDSLFLSLELVNALGCDKFSTAKFLLPSYLQCFEVLLTFLHTHDMLSGFIMGLIEFTHKTDDEDKGLLAALWVSEILKTLIKCKQFIDKLKCTSSTDMESKNKHELKSLYHHWFPNEKMTGLLLDLQKSVPPELRNIDNVQPIISTYNPYLKFFVKDLLNLVEPQIPVHVKSNICQLAKLISNPQQRVSNLTKMYTVDDLIAKEENVNTGYKCEGNIEDTDDSPMDIEENIIYTNPDTGSNCVWKLACANYDWSICPIGLLPWQQSPQS